MGKKAEEEKRRELKASVGKYLARVSQTSEHIDREASSTELTLCLVCEVLLLKTFDGQHICSYTHKRRKRCRRRSKTSHRWQHDRMCLNLAAFEITQVSVKRCLRNRQTQLWFSKHQRHKLFQKKNPTT